MVYLLLCQSLLSYCITTWGGAAKTYLIKLERAQRAVLKTFVGRDTRFPQQVPGTNAVHIRELSKKYMALLSEDVIMISAEFIISQKHDKEMSKNNHNKEVYNKLLEAELELDQLLNSSIKSVQVDLLHKYNDVKDATQVVINHIANIEGTSVTEIHRRLGLQE